MSGQAVGGVAGTLIGAVAVALAPETFGVSIALGAAIGGAVGSLAGGLYDTATADDIINEQQSISDLSIQTSTYGATIPQVFGQGGGIAGNVFWATEKVEHEQRESQSAGGKGGGPSNITITKTYTISMAIGIADTRVSGPIAHLAKIYRDATLYWSSSAQTDLPAHWTFYTGAPDQPVDPLIESVLGVGNTPRYPYLCYVVIEDDDLWPTGRTFNYTFEIEQGQETGEEALVVPSLGTLARSPYSDNLWVTAPRRDEIWIFDPTTVEPFDMRRITDGTPQTFFFYFGYPILADTVGDIWVMGQLPDSGGTSQAVKYSEQGTYESWGFGGQVPSSNIVESDGSAWACWYDPIPTGSKLYRFTAGSVPVAITCADGAAISRLCVGLDEDVWKCNLSTGVERIDAASNLIGGTIYSLTGYCADILTGADGDIWVAEETTGMVHRIDPGSTTITDSILVGTSPVRLALATDGYIWVACRDLSVWRINPADSMAASVSVPGIHDVDGLHHILCAGAGGRMWVVSYESNTLTLVDDTLDIVITLRMPAQPYDIIPDGGGGVWITALAGHSLIHIGPDGEILGSAGESTAGGLAAIARKLCVAAGYDAETELQLDDLPSGTAGMILVSQQAVRAPLQQLAQAYRFYALESGEQLKFRAIGSGGVVAAISEDDIDTAEDSASSTGLEITRIDNAQIPSSLDLTYLDPLQNYQRNTQRLQVNIPDSEADTPRTISLQLVLMPDQAKQIVQEALYTLWVEREHFRLSLPRKYAYLEPGDRVTVTVRGITYAVTLGQTSYGAPGIMECEAVSDGSFVRGALGSIGGSVTQPPPASTSSAMAQVTTATLLNLYALSAQDRTPRYHVAFTGEATGWPGASLYRSQDSEASYQAQATTPLQGVVGTVAAIMPDAPDYHEIDEATVITVVLEHGELLSVTAEAIVAGSRANLAALGSGDTWEIFSFRDAMLVAEHTYQLSYLWRGRRGTEWTTAIHGASETFVLLDSAVRPVPMTLVDRNIAWPYKPVTFGQNIADVTATTFTPTAANLIPWSVITEANSQDADGNWTLEWCYRSRFGGDWVDGEDVPIGFDEDFVGFKVLIYDDNTFTTIKRTIMTNGGHPLDPAAVKYFLYLASLQVVDFGSVQGTLYYTVAAVATNATSVVTQQTAT